MKRFDGQVAVVTGAASGIGRQLSLDLVARGATVYGLDRVPIAEPHPSTLLGRTCELATPGAFEAALAAVADDAGTIDLLANVAGTGEPTSAVTAEPDVFARVMQVNFFAPVAGTLQVLPAMVQRGRGTIVNVSSDSVRTPIAGEGPYVSSKAALSAFTESVALEVRDRGVHVHVLYPGFVVDTAMGREALASGMKPPPRSVRRTAQAVSNHTLDHLGDRAIEINAAPVAKVGQLVRIVSPRAFERLMAGRAMPTPDA